MKALTITEVEYMQGAEGEPRLPPLVSQECALANEVKFKASQFTKVKPFIANILDQPLVSEAIYRELVNTLVDWKNVC